MRRCEALAPRAFQPGVIQGNDMEGVNLDGMILRIKDDDHIFAHGNEVGVGDRDFASIGQADDERSKIRVQSIANMVEIHLYFIVQNAGFVKAARDSWEVFLAGRPRPIKASGDRPRGGVPSSVSPREGLASGRGCGQAARGR